MAVADRTVSDGRENDVVDPDGASAAAEVQAARLNQLALADPQASSAPTIVVGISGSYNPWFQQIDGPDGGWRSLSGGWKPL